MADNIPFDDTQNYPFCRLQLLNQPIKKSPKLSQRKRKLYHKALRTRVINIPMSPPSLYYTSTTDPVHLWLSCLWWGIAYFWNKQIIDILILGCCTRFSCSLIKLYSYLAKITLPSIHPLYPVPYLPIRWTNWPINEVSISSLNWRQIFPCQYTHVF